MQAGRLSGRLLKSSIAFHDTGPFGDHSGLSCDESECFQNAPFRLLLPEVLCPGRSRQRSHQLHLSFIPARSRRVGVSTGRERSRFTLLSEPKDGRRSGTAQPGGGGGEGRCWGDHLFTAATLGQCRQKSLLASLNFRI